MKIIIFILIVCLSSLEAASFSSSTQRSTEKASVSSSTQGSTEKASVDGTEICSTGYFWRLNAVYF